jgi:hypothetical protein
MGLVKNRVIGNFITKENKEHNFDFITFKSNVIIWTTFPSWKKRAKKRPWQKSKTQ